MFKWPGTPSVRPPEHELADYAELVCWKDNITSTTVLSADLGRLEENDYSDGVPEEEEGPQVVAEALSRSRWANTSYDAGLLFDRCRIVDFCDDISEDVLKKVTTWTEAAAEESGLPGP